MITSNDITNLLLPSTPASSESSSRSMTPLNFGLDGVMETPPASVRSILEENNHNNIRYDLINTDLAQHHSSISKQQQQQQQQQQHFISPYNFFSSNRVTSTDFLHPSARKSLFKNELQSIRAKSPGIKIEYNNELNDSTIFTDDEGTIPPMMSMTMSSNVNKQISRSKSLNLSTPTNTTTTTTMNMGGDNDTSSTKKRKRLNMSRSMSSESGKTKYYDALLANKNNLVTSFQPIRRKRSKGSAPTSPHKSTLPHAHTLRCPNCKHHVQIEANDVFAFHSHMEECFQRKQQLTTTNKDVPKKTTEKVTTGTTTTGTECIEHASHSSAPTTNINMGTLNSIKQAANQLDLRHRITIVETLRRLSFMVQRVDLEDEDTTSISSIKPHSEDGKVLSLLYSQKFGNIHGGYIGKTKTNDCSPSLSYMDSIYG